MPPASDSGAPGDDITNVAPPVIDGQGGADGDVIALYDGNAIIGSGTVSSGAWSVSATTPLSVGSNVLSATETDIAGNVSVPSGGLTVTLDTTIPPAPTGVALTSASDTGAPNDDLTKLNTPVVTGSGAVDGDTITLYDGGTSVGSGVVSGGQWSITTSVLSDGGHALTAQETEVAGNVSPASTALNITIDTVPPAQPTSVTLDPASDSGVPGDDITNVASPVIDGQGGADGDVIALYDGNAIIGSGTVSSGAWSVSATTPLSVGSNVLSATETDIAGNVSVPSGGLTVTLDTTIPPAPTGVALTSASDTGAPNDDLTKLNTPVVTGSGAVDGDTITLYDGGTSVGSGVVSGGQWSITTSVLSDGGHALTAQETEVAGNVSPASTALNITIDTCRRRSRRASPSIRRATAACRATTSPTSPSR